MSKRQELELSNQPTIIISDRLHSQINTLHREVGKLEWSGPLFLTKMEGDISDPGSLVYRAEYVMLKDIGSPSNTEYSIEEDIFALYEKYPYLEDCKIGHLHTHHGMNTFFSTVDVGELHTNTPNHNYYISLIVNFDCQWKCKIAFIAKQERELVFTGTEGEEESITLTTSEVLVHMNCKVVMTEDEGLLDDIIKYKAKNTKRVADTKKVPNTTDVIPLKLTPKYWEDDYIQENDGYNYEEFLPNEKDVKKFLAILLTGKMDTVFTLKLAMQGVRLLKQVNHDNYMLKLTDKLIQDSYNSVFPNQEYSLYEVISEAVTTLYNEVDTKDDLLLNRVLEMLEDCLDVTSVE